ncbi:MAG TPA: hypothetical protein PLL75_02235 [Candidatus Omnitrophota bacterium]|nr:hypothetical protein [Candidatus Omnitrophota bacterium]HPS36530.1 hypothetical protein [Candidatus Omnitrophota bacterium]
MDAYEKLIELKYKKGVPTFRLIKQFPRLKKKIHEVALIGLRETTLKKTVRDRGELKRFLRLKKKYAKVLCRRKDPGGNSWLGRLWKNFF